MSIVADPVGEGLVQSLARPGGNVTGRSGQGRDLVPKMLELFHSTAPHAELTAVLVNTRNPLHESLWRDAEAAAQSLHMKLLRVETPGAAGLDAAFDAIVKARADALFMLPDDTMSFNYRTRIVEFAGTHRLPSLFGPSEFVEAGGLSYGENYADSYRQSTVYIDKLVHGASPADLPIEQPMHFELVVNLKTAKAIGIAIPQSILLRADKVLK